MGVVTRGTTTAGTGGAQRNANDTTSKLVMDGGTLNVTGLFEVRNSGYRRITNRYYSPEKL